MGQPTSQVLRLSIVKMRSEGSSFSEISGTLKVSYNTVRQIWKLYSQSGEAGLSTKYHVSSARGSTFAPEILTDITRLRQESLGGWGANRIRIELLTLYPDLPIPSERSISRYLYEKKMY